jgi:hypothetical protein
MFHLIVPSADAFHRRIPPVTLETITDAAATASAAAVVTTLPPRKMAISALLVDGLQVDAFPSGSLHVQMSGWWTNAHSRHYSRPILL